jgi:hypothetical protein
LQTLKLHITLRKQFPLTLALRPQPVNLRGSRSQFVTRNLQLTIQLLTPFAAPYYLRV